MIKKQGVKRILAGLVAAGVIASSISVYAASAQKKISVSYNNMKVTLNGQQISMKDASGKTIEPFAYDNTTYVPVRAISQALGLTVAYNNAKKTITLTASTSGSTTSGTSPTGTPPTGTPPTGTPPTGTPPTGTPPTGTPTTGTPPTGTPPTGTPPTGTLPTGTQPTGTQSAGGSDSSTASTVTSGTQSGSTQTAANTTSAASSKTAKKAVAKKITIANVKIKVILNGKEISLKDANGKTVIPISYNGTTFLPVRAIAQALGLTVTYNSSTCTVVLTSGNGSGTNQGTPANSSDSSDNVTGTAAYTQKGETVTKADQTITATKSNESAVMVTDSGNLTLSNSAITKASGDTTSEGSSNFTGLNAAILAKSGSTLNISGTTVNTSSDGSNAIFSTGDGTTINVSDVTINTTKNSSRGLDATYNGKINATNVNITTQGAHCAAIATDRGEGTITVTGGTMNTAGEGSPGIYSTGNITINGATLKATGSEAAAIEGKNSITLNDTVLSGAKKWGVMIYQSYSGDAGLGTGTFTMTGGSLTAETGPLFYSTNTNAVINLKNAKLSAASGILLTAGANQWGTTGSNGANVTLTGDTQTLDGNITCDSISTISTMLKNSTTLTGSINADNKAKSISLSIDSTSKWAVTGTSYLTSLTDADITLSNIDDNGNTIYYDASNSANSWLAGQTFTLTDGGKLMPVSGTNAN